MSGRLHGPTMDSAFLWLWPIERLLVLTVGFALGVDRGVWLSGLRQSLASAALMDHGDVDVARRQTRATGPLGLVERGAVNLCCVKSGRA